MKHLNICNIYIAFWCLYYLQGTVYKAGSIISQTLLIFNLLISIYYAIYAYRKYRFSAYLKGLTVLILLFTIYGSELIISGDVLYKHHYTSNIVGNFTYIKSIFISLLPIYPFYVFSMKGMLTEKTIRRWTFFFLIVATCSYYNYERQAILASNALDPEEEEFTNNIGYVFLTLLPLVFFFRKKVFLQYAILAYILLYIIMGMKRGAILIAGISLPFFLYSTFKNSSRKLKFQIGFFSISLIVAIYIVIQYYLDTSEYFNYRLQSTLSGESSGRNIIYTTLLTQFLNDTTPLQFFFGRGACATLKYFGQYAHNDWLEIAINQGVLGIAVYITYFYCFIKTWRFSFSRRSIQYSVVGLILLICLIKSFFSMSYEDMGFYMTCTLGYSLAYSEKKIK